MTWASLNFRYPHFPGIVLGRGPSLDRWIEQNPEPPEGHILIGVNNVCSVVPCQFSVSCDTDANYWSDYPTQWVRGIPYLDYANRKTSMLPDEVGDCWFNHGTNTIESREASLMQSRSEIAKSRNLFIATSSAHPAIHLSAYIGLERITLVGMDGCGGRAKCTDDGTSRTPPSDKDYQGMKEITERICNTLYRDNWCHWHP